MGQIIVEKDLDGIHGLCRIIPQIHGDARGYFSETYNQRDMAEAGLDITFVQHNQSGSVKGVLRGLHFQKKHPQTKLVRVIRGKVFDVAVDIRDGSPTFGQWHGELLTEDNRHQFLIPKGLAHGYRVLSDTAEFCYLCDDFYSPEDEGGLVWNDRTIDIRWPELSKTADGNGYMVDGVPLLLAERDQRWPGIDSL